MPTALVDWYIAPHLIRSCRVAIEGAVEGARAIPPAPLNTSLDQTDLDRY